MTTIAYRDGILATDRQMHHGHYIRPTDLKLHLVHSSYSVDYAIAFAGNIIMGLAFTDWVKAGMVQGEFPIANIDNDQSFHCLLVQRNGKARPTVRYYSNDLLGMPEAEAEYVAEGAGDEFALGAMYMGATAIEAIQAANHMCADSGFGVNYVDVAGDYKIKHKMFAGPGKSSGEKVRG